MLGQHDQAIASYQECLTHYDHLHDRDVLFAVLSHLGDTYLAFGDPEHACRTWQRALEIHRLLDPNIDTNPAIGQPTAPEILSKLQRLDGTV